MQFSHLQCQYLDALRIERKGSTKTSRELEAEAVAFVVAQAIGLDAGTASSDYIQLYRGDKAQLTQSLDAVRKAASLILEAIVE